MLDDNWDLINGQDAHEIEVLNYTNQINVIEAAVRFFMHHHGKPGPGCSLSPGPLLLHELHRTGTLFLLENPGSFRTGPVHLAGPDGVTIYQPPPAQEVPEHAKVFFEDLKNMWSKEDPISVAAFCLWKINWIHPFKNGNGRTARAFSYTCLSLKYGFKLPGAPTVLDLITANRPDLYAALRSADKALVDTGKLDLTAMKAFVEGLLIKQFSSIVAP